MTDKYKLKYIIDPSYLSTVREWYEPDTYGLSVYMSERKWKYLLDDAIHSLLDNAIHRYLARYNAPISPGLCFGVHIDKIKLDLAFEVKHVVYYSEHIYLQLRCDELEK